MDFMVITTTLALCDRPVDSFLSVSVRRVHVVSSIRQLFAQRCVFVLSALNLWADERRAESTSNRRAAESKPANLAHLAAIERL